MGRVIVGTCDYAGCPNSGDAVQQVHMSVGSEADWVVDLCADHLKPITDTMRKALPRARKSDRSRVYTIEEIEAMKKDSPAF